MEEQLRGVGFERQVAELVDQLRRTERMGGAQRLFLHAMVVPDAGPEIAPLPDHLKDAVPATKPGAPRAPMIRQGRPV